MHYLSTNFIIFYDKCKKCLRNLSIYYPFPTLLILTLNPYM